VEPEAQPKIADRQTGEANGRKEFTVTANFLFSCFP